MKEDDKKTIYIVDDEEKNLLLMERALSQYSYNILKFRNGKEVISSLEKVFPDLVLLDVMMPEMDGYKVCSAIKNNEKTKFIPVILVTGLDELRDKIRGLEAGADEFISKPFHPMELKARVKSLLRIKILHDELEEKNRLLRNEKIHLEQLVRERTKELEDITLGIISALEKASELNDPDTGLHILRVCEYSKILSSGLSLDPLMVQKVERYASLHDIGKVCISDTILKKKGELIKEEFEEMKKHTIYGYELLKLSKAHPVAQNIALYHHEKYDGGGYPYGLKSNNIPVEAKIVAVADVYDALTTRRCYKRPYTILEAEEIMKSESGKHFDPDIVEIMFKRKNEFDEVREKYKETS